MDGRAPGHGPLKGAIQDKLESWKAIAAYLKRDVTTVQRWERREGMPVHRHLHDKQGSVYAFRSELDGWSRSRRAATPEDGESPGETLTLTGEGPAGGRGARGGRRAWLVTGMGVLLLATALVAGWVAAQRDVFWRDPLSHARITQLSDLSKTAEAAAISHDGRFVAFLSEGDGRTDVWVTEVGSRQYRNLTRGTVPELVNASIRTLGFSPDNALATIWSRKQDGSRPDDINILTVPLTGGTPVIYLPTAAEAAWSGDGRRLVYHTTAPGDPLFVKNLADSTSRQIYVAPAGVHCHFPLWSADGEFVYFTRGVPPDDWDIWRIRVAGGGLERITSHHSRVSHPVLLDPRTLLYLASDAPGAGPWLFSVDVERRIPHRLNFGLEQYTSLDASADGTRLVATAASVHASISRLTLSADPHVAPAFSSGTSPRVGPDYLLYVTSNAGRQGIWTVHSGENRELWSSAQASLPAGPAIAPDGRRIAFDVVDAEKTSLFVMDSDGTHLAVVTDSLALRGNPAWMPDGRSIVSAVMQGGEPRLMVIPLDGGAPRVLVAEYSIDPVWSPDGQFLLYSGPDVGTTFEVRAAAADGRPYPLPPLILPRGARRVVFWRDTRSVVVLRGEFSHKSFRLVDLQTGAERALGDQTPISTIGDFDVSRSGDEIVFDHVEKNSQIALIERAH